MKILRTYSFALVIATACLFSQELIMANPGGHLPLTALTTEWQLDREIDGIQIYARRIECHDIMNGIFKENVMLKFVNTTAQNVRLDWGMEFYYDGECVTCGKLDTEYHYILDLDAGASIEGSCDQKAPREVKFFLRFLNYDHIAKLSKYNLANLKVMPR